MKSFCRSVCSACCLNRRRISKISETDDDALIPKVDSVVNEDDIIVKESQREERKENKRIIETYPDDDPSYSEPCIKNEWIREEEKGLIPMVSILNNIINK